MTTTSSLFLHRKDTSSNWTISTDPLLAGELGVDLTTQDIKLGDGSTLWPALPTIDTAPFSIYSTDGVTNIPINVDGSLFTYIKGEWRPGPTLPVVSGNVQYTLQGFDDINYTTVPTDGQGLQWSSVNNYWEPVNPVSSKIRLSTAPSSATATGVQGTVIFAGNYIYVCVASNTWRRALFSTW